MPDPSSKSAPDKESSTFSSIEEAIGDIREGRIVIMVDDEDRENEGDFVMAAERVTPEAINFMTKEGRGLATQKRHAASYRPDSRRQSWLLVDSGRRSAYFSAPGRN